MNVDVIKKSLTTEDTKEHEGNQRSISSQRSVSFRKGREGKHDYYC